MVHLCDLIERLRSLYMILHYLAVTLCLFTLSWILIPALAFVSAPSFYALIATSLTAIIVKITRDWLISLVNEWQQTVDKAAQVRRQFARSHPNECKALLQLEESLALLPWPQCLDAAVTLKEMQNIIILLDPKTLWNGKELV